MITEVMLLFSAELGLRDGMEIAVADVTSPSTVLFRVKLKT